MNVLATWGRAHPSRRRHDAGCVRCGLQLASSELIRGPVQLLPECWAAHHAYVVVQDLSGESLQRCVGFDGSEIDGQSLMDKSGIEYASHQLTSGKAVRQVDNEPHQFSQCFPQNQPYWALFIESHDTWTSAPGGFTDAKLHDTEARGWHYVSAKDSSPAPPPLPHLAAE